MKSKEYNLTDAEVVFILALLNGADILVSGTFPKQSTKIITDLTNKLGRRYHEDDEEN
jgi:hypothetical protein